MVNTDTTGGPCFFFQAEDGIRDLYVTGSDVCSSDLRAELHDNLGTLLVRENELDAAAAEFQQALALNPDLSLALFHLGVLQSEQKQFALAEANLRSEERRVGKVERLGVMES